MRGTQQKAELISRQKENSTQAFPVCRFLLGLFGFWFVWFVWFLVGLYINNISLHYTVYDNRSQR